MIERPPIPEGENERIKEEIRKKYEEIKNNPERRQELVEEIYQLLEKLPPDERIEMSRKVPGIWLDLNAIRWRETFRKSDRRSIEEALNIENVEEQENIRELIESYRVSLYELERELTTLNNLIFGLLNIFSSDETKYNKVLEYISKNIVNPVYEKLDSLKEKVEVTPKELESIKKKGVEPKISSKVRLLEAVLSIQGIKDMPLLQRDEEKELFLLGLYSEIMGIKENQYGGYIIYPNIPLQQVKNQIQQVVEKLTVEELDELLESLENPGKLKELKGAEKMMLVRILQYINIHKQRALEKIEEVSKNYDDLIEKLEELKNTAVSKETEEAKETERAIEGFIKSVLRPLTTLYLMKEMSRWEFGTSKK